MYILCVDAGGFGVKDSVQCSLHWLDRLVPCRREGREVDIS